MVEIYLYNTGKHTYTPTIKPVIMSHKFAKKEKINQKIILQYTKQVGLKSVYLQNIHTERQVIMSHESAIKIIYNTQNRLG